MRKLSFEDLVEINCFSEDEKKKQEAAEELEERFGCEIFATEIDRSVLFAHHGRGCTVVAAKLSKGVIIFQNVTIGSNQKYNLKTGNWENVGTPILAENVIVNDGAKIFGPVVIGANTIVAPGTIITKDVPANKIAYGVNQWRDKNPDYVYTISREYRISPEEIIQTDKQRIEDFKKLN